MKQPIEVATYTMAIDAPIDHVFGCLAEDEHIVKWNDHLIENIYEDGNASLVTGKRFISVQQFEKKEIRVESELTYVNRPHTCEVQAVTNQGVSIATYTLSETADGTDVTIRISLVPSSWLYALYVKAFRWAIRLIYDEQFKQFRIYAEASVPKPSPAREAE
ncbi:SRPBCC family protein [Exiguobacterium sp. SL-10]|uniref:SRPBCC family protein n=1 Tax=Exiguobacterium sp. SL-10 TaxID=2510962 RepID=UPI00103A687B|nr:SRPBCC family protein [Exiguobacterium sp. SL-10]TCI30637.1 SRPBCC family protein [Exiguobacterium sp. SL-10]